MEQDVTRTDVAAAPGGKKGSNAFVRFFSSIWLFLRQVVSELRKVVTPTRSELIKFTAVVLGFVIVMMALVYGLDLLFTLVTQVVFGVQS